MVLPSLKIFSMFFLPVLPRTVWGRKEAEREIHWPVVFSLSRLCLTPCLTPALSPHSSGSFLGKAAAQNVIFSPAWLLWPGAEPCSPPRSRNCLRNCPLSALLALGSPSSWISPCWGRRSFQLPLAPSPGLVLVSLAAW